MNSFWCLKLFFRANFMTELDQSKSVNENHYVLLNILCRQREGLNVVHFNARSLNGLKLDYVRTIFENSRVDIICVTETWFCDDLVKHYNIKGYKLFHNNRTSKKGGGVAIYCKSNIKAELVNKSVNSDVEFLNVSLCDHSKKILVSCVYNPNKSFSLEPFFSDFNSRAIDYDFFVTCGDLNVNFLTDDKNKYDLCEHVHSVGLSIVNKLMPTRYSPNCCPSLLDYMLVSDINYLLLFDQISFISDHDLLFCTLDICLTRDSSTTSITYRDYSSINLPSLFLELSEQSANDYLYVPNVDEKLNVVLTNIHNLYDKHVPIKTICVRNNSCPWYTHSVREAIKYRNRCYNVWKRHPSLLNRTIYTNARNNATTVTRQAKIKYFSQKLDISLPFSQLWKNVKKLGVHSRALNDCNLDPDILNNFFCIEEPEEENNVVLQPSMFCSSTFEFSPVSENNVYDAVMNVKSNAIGEDGVSMKFLKIILPYFVKPLTHIFNHCITTSSFPMLWKIGKITPVAKVTNALSPSDYRPISILPVLSKVFESLLSAQITHYLNDNKLISPLQSGFRAGHSCTTAVLKVLDDIREQLDESNMSLMCFLDFSKAFDRVNHRILCQKLKYYFGFSQYALHLIESYLTGRAQKVVVGSGESCLKIVTSGVPQGSVLGPLLFSIFVNDVFLVCKNCNIHAYADDIQLYISNRIGLIEDMCCRLNDDLNEISKWSEENKLLLNPKKSYILPINHSKIDISDLPNVFLGSTALQYVTKVKYLGFYVNSCLSSRDHINSTIKNIYFVLRNLRLSSNYIPTEIKRRLVIQLILPLINYFSEVYSKLDSRSLHSLLVSLNNATRFVYNLNRFTSISCWRKMILGCDLEDYLKMRNLVFLHRLLVDKKPLYLYEKLSFGQSRRNMTLISTKHNLLSTSRMFFVNAVKLWNNLPVEIKIISRKSSFKNAIMFLLNSGNHL